MSKIRTTVSAFTLAAIFTLSGLLIVQYLKKTAEAKNQVNILRIYEFYEIPSFRETKGKFWQIIKDKKTLEKFELEYGLVFPSVDFSINYLLWSDGRKIKKIEYLNSSIGHYPVPTGLAEFEEEHLKHTAFVYLIEKKVLKQDDENW